MQGRESIPGLRKDSRPVALLSELGRTLMKFGDHHVTAFEAHHGLAQMGLRPSLLLKVIRTGIFLLSDPPEDDAEEDDRGRLDHHSSNF
jgi:hypothetical protein